MARSETEAQRQARLARRRAREAEKRRDPAYRAKLRAAQKRWRDANPDKVRATNRRMYRQNRDAVLERHAEWKRANREQHRRHCERAKARASVQEPESLAAYAAALRWDELMPARIAEQRREFVTDCLQAEFAMLAVAWFG